MKVWIPLTLVFAFGSGAYAQDTCTHPGNPSNPPDGSTSSKDEMIAGSKQMVAYKDEMDGYLKCIQTKLDAVPATDPKTLKGDDKKAAEQQAKERDQLTKKYDAAVDEEKANAEKFNVQLRIYKAKNK